MSGCFVDAMRVLPIGTSRLHEPMSLLAPGEVAFLGCGYVHTSGQVLDMLRLLTRQMELTPNLARWFFRRDQTPPNPFSPDLWQEQAALNAAVGRMRAQWDSSTGCFIEICTPRSYRMNGLHVQGNPNIDRNVGYAEIWKQGYYTTYEPDLGVTMFDESLEQIGANIGRICDILAETGRSAVMLGHLVDPADPHPSRAKNNAVLKAAIDAHAHGSVAYFDCSTFVEEHGFRVLDNGTIDIHHLPWSALDSLSEALMEAMRALAV